MLPPMVRDDPPDKTSIVFAVTRAMSKLEELNYAYNGLPYLWDGRKWTPGEGWLHALSHSFHGLIRTGELVGKGSRCFYTSMHAAWKATQREALQLNPYGVSGGVPLEDGVLNLYPREYVKRMTRSEREAVGPCSGFDEDGNPDDSRGAFGLLGADPDFDLISVIPPKPSDGNMHIVPARAMHVISAMQELIEGKHTDSLLVQFLKSSLNNDQQLLLQRWFGYHLVLHRIPKQDKMVYLYGVGGNGKGMVLDMLRGLVTDDAVATLRLRDLKISAHLEALAGKASMMGYEGTPETDNELLKQIVAWEKIPVNPKYRDPFDIFPKCLVTQASNDKPEFQDESDAMVRRVIAIFMEFKANDSNRIADIASRVLKDEYHLLVAWALNGAQDVLRADALVIPESIRTHSEQVVRPVRPVDRFMSLLEFGNFEVAEQELYAAYALSSKRQGITKVDAQAEFFKSLDTRLERSENKYLRRAKVTGYPVQTHIDEHRRSVALCPQLLGVKDLVVFFGFRIAEGPFGPPIGVNIPRSGEFKRRNVPDFESGT